MSEQFERNKQTTMAFYDLAFNQCQPEELGPNVSWPPVGMRVGIPWLYSSCGHCEQCVRGKEILCPQAQITGITVDGGYQEYMVAPAAYVAPLPNELDDIHAAPLMDAGLTVFNGLMQGTGCGYLHTVRTRNHARACGTRFRLKAGFSQYIRQLC